MALGLLESCEILISLFAFALRQTCMYLLVIIYQRRVLFRYDAFVHNAGCYVQQ